VTAQPALAPRVLAILARDIARRDEDLAAELGVSLGELSPVIGLLYRQQRADRCAGYLVAVPPAEHVRPLIAPLEAAMTPPTRSHGDRAALLDVALACAARGWHVFPLQPAASVPRCTASGTARAPARARAGTPSGSSAPPPIRRSSAAAGRSLRTTSASRPARPA